MIRKKKNFKKMSNEFEIELIIKHRNRNLIKYDIEPLSMEESVIIGEKIRRIRHATIGNGIELIFGVICIGRAGRYQTTRINNRN